MRNAEFGIKWVKNIMKAENVIVDKSKAFALRIIKLYKYLLSEKKEYVLSKQILRSGTSIGANVKEAIRGQSKADFYAKMNIALKEASETEYWLELLGESGYIEKIHFDSMNSDCQELISILVAITKNAEKMLIQNNSALRIPNSEFEEKGVSYIMNIIDGGVCAAKGFKASGLYCGIKENPTKKNDICLIVSDVMCNAAGVYTSNKVKGAPVVVTKNNLAKSGGKAMAVIANSKNANTCNADGEEKAMEMCKLTADALGIAPEQVIVASTGVIGQILPIEPIREAVPQLVEKLSYTGNVEAATAIMTTDTVKKEYAVEFEIGGKLCKMGGMAKGSGMIHPNMATTLNFITTDCTISAELLQKALSEICLLYTSPSPRD